MRTPRTVPVIVARLSLMAAAVGWWSLLLNICSNVPQPDLSIGRTIPFNCPISGLAFVTPLQRMFLYLLVPVCLVLMGVDFALRKRARRG
jgi:hypothetical protein